MTYMKSCFPRDFTDRSFILGREYMAFGRRLTFIRSTPKGFNFVDHDYNRLLLMGYHLYDRRFSGIVIPEDRKEFTVKIQRVWDNIIKNV